VVGSGRDNFVDESLFGTLEVGHECGVEPHRIRRDVDDREDVDDRVGSVSEDNARSSAAEAASLPSIGTRIVRGVPSLCSVAIVSVRVSDDDDGDR